MHCIGTGKQPNQVIYCYETKTVITKVKSQLSDGEPRDKRTDPLMKALCQCRH